MSYFFALQVGDIIPTKTVCSQNRVKWQLSKVIFLLVVLVLQLGQSAASGGRLRSSTKVASAEDAIDEDSVITVRDLSPVQRDKEESGQAPPPHVGRNLVAKVPIRVGAFYYPFWGPDRHYGFGTFRDRIGQSAEVGANYDDTDTEVILEHMKQMERGNMNLWISSWMGRNSREDQTLLKTVLPTLTGSEHEVAIFYETEKLMMNGFSGEFSTSRAVADMDYLTTEYFPHRQYYKMRSRRPVVVLKLTPATLEVEGRTIEDIVLLMRTEANKHDYSLYLVAAFAGGATPQSKRLFGYFDAVTNMDFAGSVGMEGAAGVVNATREQVEAHFETEDTISSDAFVQNCFYIPTVSPGFNSRAFLGNQDLPILSRELEGAKGNKGSLFRLAVQEAKKRVLIEAEYLMFVESFNQFHHDTQIESVIGPTPTGPERITGGLEYPAYGTLYLEILYNLTHSLPAGPNYPNTYRPDPEDDFSQGSLNIGVYYYPWHAGDFHSGGGYAREDIGHRPELGEYDDRKPEVVEAHLNWSRQGNINTWVCSWWGPGSREDTTIRNAILKHPKLFNHKIALFYETTGRIRGNNDKVGPDIQFICQKYFDHPNYLRINDRPVLFVYITRVLTSRGSLKEVIALMREAAAKNGHPDIYIVGDQVFGSPPREKNYGPFNWLDGVTTYDVYGSLARGYAYQEGVDRHYDRQQQWKDKANEQNCAFIPAVNAGYNDRGVRLSSEHLPLSRQLTPDSRYGTLFAANLKRALLQLDPKAANLLLINSWNEWHEDSQIEPAVGEETTKPYKITKGLRYKGYGTLYLDILSNATRRGDFEVQETIDSKEPSGRDLYLTDEDVTPVFRSFGVEPDDP